MTTSANAKRRVVFCTYPSLYSDLVLDTLLQAEQLDVVGVVCSTRAQFMQHIRQSGWRYALYLGLITTGYFSLRKLWRRSGWQQRLAAQQVPFFNTADINAPESLSFIRDCQADVLLCAHFNQVLGAEALALPKLAPLNIHPSLLPSLQGVDPAFYALLRYMPETGVTVHLQDAYLDHGAILMQSPVKPRRQDSLLSLNVKLFKLGAISAVQAISQLTPDTQGEAQQETGGYDSWPSRQDSKQFRRQRPYWRWQEYRAFIRMQRSC